MKTVALATLLLVALTACAAHGRTASVVTVSVDRCGRGWHAGAAGRRRIALRDTDTLPGQAQLVGTGARNRGRVYADVDPIGPGSTVPVRLDLPAGSYGWRCLMQDEAAVTGPSARVSGRSATAPSGAQPATYVDLERPSLHYVHWVLGRLPGLRADTRRLVAALGADDRPAAERAWLRAHLDYERLGAAYGAFGPLDDAINGLPDGLPGGVYDRHWTGFHRIEHALWHGAPPRSLTGIGHRLLHAERGLSGRLRHDGVDPTTLALRVHEISENILQFQLTGTDDFGSHSDLATADAALRGSLVVLDAVRPVLRSHGQWSASYPRQIKAVLALVDRDMHRYGHLGRLPRTARERLDAAISGLCQRLSVVAGQLEPRRTE